MTLKANQSHLRGVSVITRELSTTASQQESWPTVKLLSLSSARCYRYGARWFFLDVFFFSLEEGPNVLLPNLKLR